MRCLIRTGGAHAPGVPETPERPPGQVFLSLDPAINRCAVAAVVREGERVVAGQTLARGEALCIHAPISGAVRAVESGGISLQGAGQIEKLAFPPVRAPSAAEWPAFAAEMGLAGMGGSLFPASIKLRAANGVHTLAINAVECEPGIGIDEALLIHAADSVAAGVGALVGALGIRSVVLAVKRSSVARLEKALPEFAVRVLAMPNRYPAGAEKLIVGQLMGRLPPAGRLPAHLGFLVMSVASLWAVGRRIREGRPSIDRPLTLVPPTGPGRNLVVPVGASIRSVLEWGGVECPAAGRICVAGGLMMGRMVSPDSPVTKGTNAIFVLDPSERLRCREEPCILCGACFDVCPLGLHPIGMADRIRARRPSSALRAQLDECFLCGACSAVCPAGIPLVQYFHEGKAWLKKRTT